MARQFRLWQKKRGDRRTGSKLAGSLGEALFFGTLFLLGAGSLTSLVASQVLDPRPELYQPGFGFWLTVLVLASFIVVGGGGVILAVLGVASAERRSALAKRAADLDLISEAMPSSRHYPNIPRDANLTNSPGIKLAFRLPMLQTSGWQLLVATVFCLLWNGVTAVLLVWAINSHLAGEPEWFLTIFVLPLLAVGGWAIYFFIRQMLLHTGIGPTSVEISAHPLYPGQQYDVYLTQSGRLSLRWLEGLLVCEEEATYHQGTDIRTDSCVVFREQFFRREDFTIAPGMPFEHECRLRIPSNVMHSFQAGHNAVHWKLVVRGEAKSWPPFERCFPVVVYPSVHEENRASWNR